jgi:hypothetical protein
MDGSYSTNIDPIVYVMGSHPRFIFSERHPHHLSSGYLNHHRCKISTISKTKIPTAPDAYVTGPAIIRRVHPIHIQVKDYFSPTTTSPISREIP